MNHNSHGFDYRFRSHSLHALSAPATLSSSRGSNVKMLSQYFTESKCVPLSHPLLLFSSSKLFLSIMATASTELWQRFMAQDESDTDVSDAEVMEKKVVSKPQAPTRKLLRKVVQPEDESQAVSSL